MFNPLLEHLKKNFTQIKKNMYSFSNRKQPEFPIIFTLSSTKLTHPVDYTSHVLYCAGCTLPYTEPV